MQTRTSQPDPIATALFDGSLDYNRMDGEELVIPAANTDKPILIGQNTNRITTGNGTSQSLIQEQAKGALTIEIGEGSSCIHYLIQPKGLELSVRAAKEAKYTLFVLQTEDGANSFDVQLIGENAEAKIFGIAKGDKKETIENKVLLKHLAPDTFSRQQLRVQADSSAQITFKGDIKISKEGTKADAGQLSKGLLLSDKAAVHIEPWLEIDTDDVKAAHGTSVGQLDPSALFYLQTRGIQQEDARAILQQAFVDELLAQIPLEAMKDYFVKTL